MIVYINKTVPEKLQRESTIILSNQISEDKRKNVKEIIHDTQKLVVMIETENSLGSGFLYNKKGDIITNAHVVTGSSKVKIKMANYKQLEGMVIGISKEIDVAVIRVKGLTGKEPLPLSKRDAEVGDEVLALGSPLGLQNSVTSGMISGVNRDLEIPPFSYKNTYQISAPIAPGNSGGPLIRKDTGEVIGINSALSEEGQIGFSLPITQILPLVENWSKHPKI